MRLNWTAITGGKLAAGSTQPQLQGSRRPGVRSRRRAGGREYAAAVTGKPPCCCQSGVGLRPQAGFESTPKEKRLEPGPGAEDIPTLRHHGAGRGAAAWRTPRRQCEGTESVKMAAAERREVSLMGGFIL
ncbi:hypothetical protein chiPu_0026225, partial [Chiloscyllium punctatum]|nr:hypothetical protein [Chiloscyllium punctatum]